MAWCVVQAVWLSKALRGGGGCILVRAILVVENSVGVKGGRFITGGLPRPLRQSVAVHIAFRLLILLVHVGYKSLIPRGDWCVGTVWGAWFVRKE